MKFALLTGTLAVAIVVCLAHAQERSTTTDAPAAHRMPAGSGVEMARLCARIDPETNFYPDHARDMHIQGLAMIECALDSTNRPETCWLLSETPPGEGFGAAAVFSACRARQHPLILERMPSVFHVDGDTRRHIQMPVSFRAPGDLTR